MSERRENSVARRTKESARERDKAAATAVVAADAAAVGPVKVTTTTTPTGAATAAAAAVTRPALDASLAEHVLFSSPRVKYLFVSRYQYPGL